MLDLHRCPTQHICMKPFRPSLNKLFIPGQARLIRSGTKNNKNLLRSHCELSSEYSTCNVLQHGRTDWPSAVSTISIACGAHHGMRLKVPVMAGTVPAASPATMRYAPQLPRKLQMTSLVLSGSSSDGQRAKTLRGDSIPSFIAYGVA